VSVLEFRDLGFSEHNDRIRVLCFRQFYFDLAKKDFGPWGNARVSGHSIEFPGLSHQKASRRFSYLLDRGFRNLRNKVNNKPAVYIHRHSGIPLVGSVSFGIVDRNTTLIEVKPITSCNLDCMYCSVDENRRAVDFVVEKDYLVEELRKIVEFKGADNIEIHINAQGEPLCYAPLEELVSDISGWSEIGTISIDTNATLLTKKRLESLVKAGITRFNVSLNALSQELANKIAGTGYPLERVKRVCEYIAGKSELLIAPVLIPGVNESEMPGLIRFAQSLKSGIGVQNFLNYRFGKNPAKAYSMQAFYNIIRDLEKRHDVKLLLDEADFNIRKTKKLPKPFSKGDIVKARITCAGRMKYDKIAVYRGRSITVTDCDRQGIVKLRITRDTHNIYYAVPS
jgi:uncharacterized Fe-S cluster-containing radical SAM superfamily enzyme